ncbi:High affinity cAMP-specific and IBMX-insensitive 3',5'-cyclic phosphodiesterase 9A [Mortierella sp. AM989]|nr:High affinity cAMP-specific and IBMX-insensitive 3',5'-cyclic phosphodiesterase 9A [Mortierella sp. AM989]
MLKFGSGKFKTLDSEFKIWEHTIPEIYGIILGMFVKLDLVSCLGITEGELLDFIIDVDRGYHATFYHSFYHAADVTAVLYHMLLDMNASQYLSKPDMTALLLAGLCHDIGHPGLNNLYQVNAKTDLVKQYGETSVLETYSCSLAMDLVAKHKLFRNVSKSPTAILPEGNYATEESMKTSMIKAIMATDMSFHYDMLNNLNTLIEFISTPSSTPSTSDSEATETESDMDIESSPSSPTRNNHCHNCPIPDVSPSLVETVSNIRARFECSISRNHRRQSSVSSASSESSENSMNSEGSTQTTRSVDIPRSPCDLTPELRQSFANCLLHAADISNAVKPWEICKHWSDLVVQEFFRQGDIEKSQNLPVSPNMDRAQYNQPQISLGFSDYVVQSYFESFVEFLPEAAPFLTTLASNREQWVLQKAAMEAKKELVLTVDTTTAVDANIEIQSATSPSTQPLTSGRRVSVAAGVVVLDDTRPQRPAHHRKSRQPTNLDTSQYHTIRKIKRSLSGRALSTCFRDFNANTPQSPPSANKTVLCPMAAISVLNKDSTVNMSGSYAEPKLYIGAQEGSADEQILPPIPSLQQRTERQDTSPRSSHFDLGPMQYRQRRHGSLQLEDRHPSIRQEYGNGYVILNHPDLTLENNFDHQNNHDEDIDARHIPADPPFTLSMPGAWPIFLQSPPTPVDSEPSLKNPTLFHHGQPQDARHDREQHPSQNLIRLHQVSSRSSTPAVLSGSIHYDWTQKSKQSGFGPLDMPPNAPLAPPVEISDKKMEEQASPMLGSSEGQDQKLSLVPFQLTVSSPSDESTVECVVETASAGKAKEKKSLWLIPGGFDGMVSITAAASNGPSPMTI